MVLTWVATFNRLCRGFLTNATIRVIVELAGRSVPVPSRLRRIVSPITVTGLMPPQNLLLSTGSVISGPNAAMIGALVRSNWGSDGDEELGKIISMLPASETCVVFLKLIKCTALAPEAYVERLSLTFVNNPADDAENAPKERSRAIEESNRLATDLPDIVCCISLFTGKGHGAGKQGATAAVLNDENKGVARLQI